MRPSLCLGKPLAPLRVPSIHHRVPKDVGSAVAVPKRDKTVSPEHAALLAQLRMVYHGRTVAKFFRRVVNEAKDMNVTPYALLSLRRRVGTALPPSDLRARLVS